LVLEDMTPEKGSRAASATLLPIRRAARDHDFDKGEHQNLNASQ
jgi:hypothetical protein